MHYTLIRLQLLTLRPIIHVALRSDRDLKPLGPCQVDDGGMDPWLTVWSRLLIFVKPTKGRQVLIENGGSHCLARCFLDERGSVRFFLSPLLSFRLVCSSHNAPLQKDRNPAVTIVLH